MINKIAVILTAVIFLIVITAGWAAFHFYGKSVEQADTISTITQQKQEAELIAKSQAAAIEVLNSISKATIDEQSENSQQSNDRQVIIKTVLKTQQCAVTPLPDDASSQLLNHYNAIRQGASNAATGSAAKTVPAKSAAK